MRRAPVRGQHNARPKSRKIDASGRVSGSGWARPMDEFCSAMSLCPSREPNVGVAVGTPGFAGTIGRYVARDGGSVIDCSAVGASLPVTPDRPSRSVRWWFEGRRGLAGWEVRHPVVVVMWQTWVSYCRMCSDAARTCGVPIAAKDVGESFVKS